MAGETSEYRRLTEHGGAAAPSRVHIQPACQVGARAHRLPMLTEREREVLLVWLASDSKTEAARSLFISAGTMNTHLTRIRAKYAAIGRPAATKAGLLARALQDGYTDLTCW